ncbi:MAG: site-specific DNA-methyltransferase [Actinomycetota bacterium]|nr:site-specific DNA-methyltransferase [Actinomycetota bacterium]
MAATEDKQTTTSARATPSAVPRLSWDGKPVLVERVALPFQVVETINESRATRETLRGSLFEGAPADAAPAWRNKLIWGDNKLIAASLLEEFAGQVNLVYIDPPFDTGTDFSFRTRIGDEEVTKQPSIIEEHAYSDTWGAGRSSYLKMMYDRLALIWELLAEDGSFYLHCAPNVSHYLKVLCDEIFGADRIRAEIVWKRVSGHGDAKKWSPVHEVILFYSKGPAFVWNAPREALSEEYATGKYVNDDGDGRGSYQLTDITSPNPRPNMMYTWKGFPYPAKGWRYSQATMAELDADGRIWYPDEPSKRPRLKRYLEENEGRLVDDVWTDIPPVNSQALERTGFDTQKPLALLERVIEASSNRGDLVCDPFCGSGTTAVAAEQLGRRWIIADLGRFAIHTSRKRLLSVPQCSPFEILNLGSYERQHWQQTATGGEVDAYLGFILDLYQAEPLDGYHHLHGKKSDRLVHVGAVDAPVTIDEIEQVMDELAANDLVAADVLGWEWEMGLHDVVAEEARRRGLELACRQIPREVMKAQLGDEVRFFELAYVALQVDRESKSARVQLRDFVIPSEELIPDSVRSKITQWSDYIDYWSVDFNFRDDTFHNEWQAYRTREEPKLAVESDWHDYEQPGRYAIVVKVIDIFGNDTTKLAEVTIR